ncbi:Vesicle transport protein GOT1 [Camellia lanceoleosa]|uniref:Vesicle transport protein GOT1 n=1 Tax=Camellia lanceoleosa TaxID=1840588 RepID=A0ACC0GG90_9ERIC|nr:Vesicle transport protein GOT1 [Camellia lanceoleosa]
MGWLGQLVTGLDHFEVDLLSWITVVNVCKDGGIIKKVIGKGEQIGPLSSQFLPKIEIRNLNKLWHHWEREKVEYFTLANLWNSLDEWSAHVHYWESSTFSLSEITANLSNHALYGGAEKGTVEHDIKTRIMDYLNIPENEYGLVFLVNWKLNDEIEIGLGLTTFGVLFSFLGIISFFDKGQLAMGNLVVYLMPTKHCVILVTLNQILFLISGDDIHWTEVLDVVFTKRSNFMVCLLSVSSIHGFWPTLLLFGQKIPIIGWVFPTTIC